MGISDRAQAFGMHRPEGAAGVRESSGPLPAQVPGESSLLSIVVLTLDSEEFIQDCLRSLPPLDQRTEVLLIDGGSRDATVSVVRRDFPWVRVSLAPGTSIPQARNLGLRRASGKYVLFLDSDERLNGDALEGILACLETEAPPFVAAHWTRINRKGEPVGVRLTGYPDPFGGLLGNPVATIGMACRRDLLLSLGGFSEAFPVAEDYDMWLRLFETAQGIRVDLYLGEHRVREDSASQTDRFRMRLFGAKASLAAAKRRRTPRRVRFLLMGHWSLAILGDLRLVPASGLRVLERVGQFGNRLHAQLRNGG